MKIKLFILLFCLLKIDGYTQPSGLIDSLKIKLVQNIGKTEVRAVILLKLAYYYQFSSSPDSAILYGEQLLSLATKLQNKKFEAYANQYVGVAECQLGNNTKGIEALLKAAELFRKKGFLNEEAHVLGNVADVFALNQDLLNCIKYNRQILNILGGLSDTLSIGNRLCNIGEAYRMMNKLDSASYYFEASLAKHKSVKDTSINVMYRHNKMTTLGNMGMLEATKGSFTKAKEYLIPATQFFKESDDSYRYSVYQKELGLIYIQEGNKKKGEELLLESLDIAQKAKLKEQIRDFSYNLSGFYEKEQNQQKALYFFKQYKVYDDSLKNVAVVREMEQQQSKFELGKKQEEIDALNRIGGLQKMIAIVLTISIMVISVLLFILYRNNKKVRKTNGIILKQKVLVEQRESEKSLLLRELNHRVKNNLQMVASLLNLNARQLKGHPAAEALIASKLRVEALTLIHQKLYRDDVDTKVDIKDYIEELSKNLVQNFGQEFELQLSLQSILINIDRAIPLGLVINELITNSLKYGKKDNKQPILKIASSCDEDNLSITIQDNGIGLPKDFNLATATSFGLKLVNSLAKQLNGELSCDSERGTKWVLNLRLDK